MQRFGELETDLTGAIYFFFVSALPQLWNTRRFPLCGLRSWMMEPDFNRPSVTCYSVHLHRYYDPVFVRTSILFSLQCYVSAAELHGHFASISLGIGFARATTMSRAFIEWSPWLVLFNSTNSTGIMSYTKATVKLFKYYRGISPSRCFRWITPTQPSHNGFIILMTYLQAVWHEIPTQLKLTGKKRP